MPDTLSVIMTVYNQADHVGEAIDSILRQTYKDFDFIIVDDGSEDTTLSEIRKHPDPRMRIFNRSHAGRGSALNFALSQTTASWIAFMDSDDIASSDRLLRQRQAIVDDPTITAISSSYLLVDSSGQLVREKHLPTTHEEIVHWMPVQCSMCFPAAMIRREILEKAGPFNEELIAAVDYDLWLKILDVAKFSNISDGLIKKRSPSTSISVKFKEAQLRNTYEMAKRYLEQQYQVATWGSKKERILQLGQLEYYHGTMSNARRYFIPILFYRPHIVIVWRYFLASCMGDKIFRLLRGSGIAESIGNIFRGIAGRSNYFAP
ncbi:MAG TPA: glycosyltransferase [Bacteroidota bacterium]|nr:glycosyltransferase [Bacteroidota bacterium]